MYYRLSYTHNDITDVKELSTNQDLIEIYAEDLLEQHNDIGTIVIERRPSEYYGDYKHVLTISHNLTDNKEYKAPNILEATSPSMYVNKYADKLCIFKQLKFDEEPYEFRRLSWICECKKSTLKDSDTRKMLIEQRNKQIALILKIGFDYEYLVDFAEY